MDFDPHKGHEQAGRRPAIILSNAIINEHNSLILVCPITNTDRGNPLHIKLDDRTVTTGVIMCDQVRMLDIKSRHAKFKEKCPKDIWKEACDLIKKFM